MITAFVALKGSGKSEACKYIESIDPDAVRVNFKDALVREVYQTMPDVIRELASVYGIKESELFVQKPPAARALLQNFGTELRRQYDHKPDYWVDRWREVVRDELDRGNHVLVDDCRFLNEAEAIRELGGRIIRIVRDDISGNDSHISETEMKEIECDTIIYTSKGDYDTFFASLDDLLTFEPLD